MKKITFILIALITGSAMAQSSATGTATVNAEIVSPIKITDGSDLDFGRLIGSAEGGKVTVSTAGGRTADFEDLLAPSTSVQAASFEVTAANQYKYSITIPDINLAGPGENMALSFISSLNYENVVGTGAPQTLNVGGDLILNQNQAGGDYTGTVEVTVSYE